jgi:hypothetical protein
VREGGQEERLQKLNTDNRMDKLVKFDGEGIRQKKGTREKCKTNKGQKKERVINVCKE